MIYAVFRFPTCFITYLFVVLFVFQLPSVYAEIATDGTMGRPAQVLSGNSYKIGSELGIQKGSNLFHSFRVFNIGKGETATFSGPRSVENIISRVTGGSPSNIDGLLRSTIADANLYFLNPAGVMFGPDASLDINGSFYVSTADYLRLGNDGRFDASQPETSILTSAPPSAFGFLSDKPAPISFSGKGELSQEEGKVLQNIIVKASAGEQISQEEEKALHSPFQVSDGKTISVIGGDVKISNGTFFVDSGNPVLLGSLNAPGGQINIVSAASAGEAVLTDTGFDVSSFRKMGSIKLSEYANIGTDNADNPGDIFLYGGDIVIDKSQISAYTSGNAGNISIQATDLELRQGAWLGASSLQEGNGGNITIHASESVSFSGVDYKDEGSGMDAFGSGKGNSGTILLETKNLVATDGAQISSANPKLQPLSQGKSGNVIIKASESVIFSGNTESGYGSSVIARTSTQGDAGNILIETKQLFLNDGAVIAGYTEGQGKGGNITIRASEVVSITGTSHQGGQSIISAASVSPEKSDVKIAEKLGNAGDIHVETKKLTLADGGRISAGADNAGGGRITLDVGEFLYLYSGRISTSVMDGKDNGGDITIFNPDFAVLNHSNIFAKAYEGNGGNIRISAKNYIASSDSIVTASSQKGIDGIVNIESPDTDTTAGSDVLPANFPDLTNLMKTKCSAESDKRISSLTKSDPIARHESDELYRRSYELGISGNSYEKEKRYSEAIVLTRQAIFFSQQYPELLYHWQWQLGRLFEAQKNTEAAIQAYSMAVRTLHPIQWEVLTQKPANAFYEEIRPVYIRYAELLAKELKPDTRPDEKRRSLEEIRNTIELMKSAELQNYFQDECIADTDEKHKPAILDKTPPHTALIYPILFSDQIFILLTLPDGMKHFRVPADAETIKEEIREFGKYFKARSIRPTKSEGIGYREPATKLYDILIRPVEQELTAYHIDTLIVSPDGVFYSIPFAALYNGSHFLVEKYAVVTIPSVMLASLEATDIQKAEILLSGLSEARHEYAALPNVKDEVKEIRNLLNSRVLLDEAYTKENLNREFVNHVCSVLHIATHGNFGASPKETFLLAYDDKLTMDELRNLVSQSRFKDKKLDLLTLSACETALGDERSAFGLAGVALKAGAKSAVATLWAVNDKSTPILIAEFYRSLTIPNTSKAKALQHAQKKMISHPGYRHPVYWAGFLLIGNWL